MYTSSDIYPNLELSGPVSFSPSLLGLKCKCNSSLGGTHHGKVFY